VKYPHTWNIHTREEFIGINKAKQNVKKVSRHAAQPGDVGKNKPEKVWNLFRFTWDTSC